MNLADKTCIPCKGGTPALKGDAVKNLLAEIPGWEAPLDHHLFRVFRFPDFKKALDFVNRVGALAEDQGHHPDLLLTWGKVEITIYTHSIDGLTESDFVLAAKIDRIWRSR
jgi:4a-hydroxytetrahydrobiopterin dehydratase